MDNITHSLFALTLARTSLGRDVRGRTAALVLASNAPDIDIVSLAGGSAGYLEWHRSLTHGPLGVVGLGLLTAAIVQGALRFGNRGRSNTRSSFTSFPALAGMATLAVLLHVLMDLPTSYGTRLLSPFDWHWFTTDSIPIVDIYLLVALTAGLYFGRATETMRRRSAVIVLALMMANYGLRMAAHHRALALAPDLFGPAWADPCQNARPQGPLLDRWPRDISSVQPGTESPPCRVEVAAIPSMLSPFDWRVILQTSNAYELRDVNVLGRGGRGARSTRYPNEWPPHASEAAAAPATRVFLGFSRFPAVQWFRDEGGGVTVRFADVRFVGVGPPEPGRPRGETSGPNARGLFGATARFDANGRLVGARLGP